MAKLASTILTSLEVEGVEDFESAIQSIPFPEGTVCVLCGETLGAVGYRTPDWGSVAKWDAFMGMDVASSVRILCRDCYRLVWLFEKKEHPNPDDPNGGTHYAARESKKGLCQGWHRAVVKESTMEHYYDLKTLKSDGANGIPYRKILQDAIFDPRAHVWAVVKGSTQISLYPYLPYTPAHSPYLHILTLSKAGPMVLHVRRQTLWNALLAITRSSKPEKPNNIPDYAVRQLASLLNPFTTWVEDDARSNFVEEDASCHILTVS